MNLDKHPILKQTYDLCIETEKLGANTDQTALISDLSDWMRKLYDYLEKYELFVK